MATVNIGEISVTVFRNVSFAGSYIHGEQDRGTFIKSLLKCV